ncbi:MAG: hypothetical protein JSW73_05255 [Candidatus Woesearchaeota archaeon]|nr:MAG: hypothetical protein JSW73_05255 [Candidatus Woesearchaeota archaeon]
MPKKYQYKYVRIETPRNIKKSSEEGGLYISESIRTADIFNKNKREQLKLIESSTKLINALIRKLNKLDVFLHEKSI